MQDRDWTGTAAAVTAVTLTVGVWLWPQEAPQVPAPPAHHLGAADDRHAEDMARWRAEARRWDGTADAVQLSAQLSAVGGGEAMIR